MSLDDALRRGLIARCRDGRPIEYRFLSAEDDTELITELLHRAYGSHAEAGLRFVAAHQDAAVTRQRLARGETVVALDARKLVGIITLARAAATTGSPFYDRPNVASFGQFAVEPLEQGQGIGSTLVDLVEQLALLRGVEHLALDTSEGATELIRFYERRGFRFVEHVRWHGVNYRSVVMAKAVRATGLSIQTSAAAVDKTCW